jgi:hypothetical protein
VNRKKKQEKKTYHTTSEDNDDDDDDESTGSRTGTEAIPMPIMDNSTLSSFKFWLLVVYFSKQLAPVTWMKALWI